MIYSLLEESAAASAASSESIWLAISGISAAVAAILSMAAIIFNSFQNKNRIKLDFITQSESKCLLKVKDYFVTYFFLGETFPNGRDKYLKLLSLRRRIEFEFVQILIHVGGLNVNIDKLIKEETPILKCLKNIKIIFKKEKTNQGSDTESKFKIVYYKELKKYFIFIKNSFNKWVLLEKCIIDDLVSYEQISQSALNPKAYEKLKVLEEYYKLYYFVNNENIISAVKHLNVNRTKKEIEKFSSTIETNLKKIDEIV